MSESPLLSIVIPTRNRPLLLRGILEEIGGCERVEIVVSDDASKLDVARQNELMTRNIPRAIYLRNDSRRGAPVARNRGAERASGHYLWFVDDDDCVPRETLDAVVERLQGKTTQLAILSATLIENGTEVAAYTPSVERDSYDNYRDKGQLVNTSCIVMSRCLFEAVGKWDERLAGGQDTDLILRLARHTRPACWSDARVWIRVDSGPRLTNMLWKQQRAKIQLLVKHWRSFTIRRRAYYLISLVVMMPLLRRLTGRRIPIEMMRLRSRCR